MVLPPRSALSGMLTRIHGLTASNGCFLSLTAVILPQCCLCEDAGKVAGVTSSAAFSTVAVGDSPRQLPAYVRVEKGNGIVTSVPGPTTSGCNPALRGSGFSSLTATTA